MADPDKYIWAFNIKRALFHYIPKPTHSNKRQIFFTQIPTRYHLLLGICFSSDRSCSRSKDNTRLVSLAVELHSISKNEMTLQDNLHEKVDVVIFNQHIGWYIERNKKIDRISWKIHYGKPIVVSKYSSKCVAEYHSPHRVMLNG